MTLITLILIMTILLRLITNTYNNVDTNNHTNDISATNDMITVITIMMIPSYRIERITLGFPTNIIPTKIA